MLYSIFGGTMLYQLMREVKTLRSRRDARKRLKESSSPRAGQSDDEAVAVSPVVERDTVVQCERSVPPATHGDI